MDSETIEFICIRFDVESHSALVSFFPACTQSRRAYCLIRIAAFSYRLILFCLPLHQFISRNVFIFFFSFFFLSVLFPSRIVAANKKAKLINGTLSAQQQTNVVGAGAGSASSQISSDEYQTYQTQFSGGQQSQRTGGPNLVNKQLVLPFVPPSFPNGSPDGSNHLIKPSEYLKSISDKRSTASSGR